LLRRIGRFFLWLLVLLVVLEIGLRFFGYGRQEIYVPDQHLLWVLKPGHYLTVVDHKPMIVNNQNFRFPVELQPKQPGQYRIFAFGDSVTQGWAVDDNSTYSTVLQNQLNASCSGENFQVISAGVNAYSNSMVAQRAKSVLASPYNPDAIILGYSFNTEFEQFTKLEGANRQALLRRIWLKSWVRRSAIYTFVIEDLLRRFVYYSLRDRLMAGSWNVGADKPVDVDSFRNTLAEIVKMTQERDVKLVFLLSGTKGQKGSLNSMQRTMLDFARQNNVPIVNVIDEWKAQDHNGLYVDHVHPNATGHALIAGDLFQAFKPLIPACSASASAANAPAAAAPALH
jgi:lysophospholipase L1-like esterase